MGIREHCMTNRLPLLQRQFDDDLDGLRKDNTIFRMQIAEAIKIIRKITNLREKKDYRNHRRFEVTSDVILSVWD
uniref:K-box domain-containing protein n=1 Tax=Setaria digitata TaxID=48799 RepID=A0A915PN00_9BILA